MFACLSFLLLSVSVGVAVAAGAGVVEGCHFFDWLFSAAGVLHE